MNPDSLHVNKTKNGHVHIDASKNSNRAQQHLSSIKPITESALEEENDYDQPEAHLSRDQLDSSESSPPMTMRQIDALGSTES